MSNTTALLGRKAYERLKFIVQILLPGVATFYLTISPLWGLPSAMEIAATITALNLLLGLFLTYDKHRYEASEAWADGEMTVQSEDGVPYRMEANLKNIENPMEIANQERVVFKVSNQDSGTQV